MEENIKYVPLNDWHAANGGKMVPFAGYNMPVRYTGDKEEHFAVRNSVGLFDVSHMGEFVIEGEEALDLVQYVFSNDASTLEVGEIQYGCLPNEKGGIVDDLLVYKFSDTKYFLVVNASNVEKDFNWITKNNSFKAKVSNISDSNCLFAIQGPKAVEVMMKLIGNSIQDLKYYNFGHYDFVGFKQVFVSNTGYTGAGGFEIMIENERALEMWQLLMTTGKEFDIQAIGLGARDTLRLEKGYCLYGNDIDDTTSPLEAGLGWVTKFTKKTVASNWLEKQKETGVQKKLVGFEMIDKGIPRSHYEVFDANNQKIGEVTSGTMSPSLNKGIGMAYIKIDHSKIGSEIYIDIRGKKLKASVLKMPFL
jgi:aminomethyltransferase